MHRRTVLLARHAILSYQRGVGMRDETLITSPLEARFTESRPRFQEVSPVPVPETRLKEELRCSIRLTGNVSCFLSFTVHYD